MIQAVFRGRLDKEGGFIPLLLLPQNLKMNLELTLAAQLIVMYYLMNYQLSYNLKIQRLSMLGVSDQLATGLVISKNYCRKKNCGGENTFSLKDGVLLVVK